MRDYPTPREIAVLRRLAEGKPYKQIALELGITHSTMRGLAALARLRIGANNSTHAVAIMDDRFPDWRERMTD